MAIIKAPMWDAFRSLILSFRRHLNRVLLLAVAVAFVACSTPSPRVATTSIYPGMTRGELLSEFGPPLRKESNAGGGEDWFYNFGSQDRQSRPVSESFVGENERSYSYGRSTTTTTTITPLSIHLSPEGRVVGPIPPGSVIIE